MFLNIEGFKNTLSTFKLLTNFLLDAMYDLTSCQQGNIKDLEIGEGIN